MPRLTVSLLGAFQAAVDGAPVSFDTAKTRALLAYLAMEVLRPQGREALAGLLWPELPEDSARRNLRNSLFKLRQALGEKEDGAGFLLVNLKTAQVDPAADVQVDAGQFSALIAACRAHRHRHIDHCVTCHERLARAAALYNGDFMAGFHLDDCAAFEEWLLLMRERLRREALRTLTSLASYHEGRGANAQALEYTYQQIELEPWREEAYQQAMRLLVASDQRSAALAHYGALRKALAVELNAEPGVATTALYERLRKGEVAPEERPASTALSKNNLQRQLTPFIGRVTELRQIVERLDGIDYSLITISGPGGVGKTRLAWQAASEQLGAFAAGVYWASLAAISDPDLIPSSIALALGLRFASGEQPRAQLLRFLRDKELLLILDNFEQLQTTGAAADLLLDILQSAPQVKILVTSRERLGLQAEVLFDLAGLPLPDPVQTGGRSAALVEPDELIVSGAVQLFVERARQTQPSFALTPDTAAAVVDICRLVEGLPLGIVLAASWVRYSDPEKIAASIRTNLDFLANSARDIPPRHSSLRAVFNHSWQLLAANEQRVLRFLAVFVGGWTAEAAERVAGASLHELASLADKSLLRGDSEGRFSIHEVLRQYAAEKLHEAGDEELVARQNHALYYLELAEQANGALSSDTQDRWLALLETEHDNLRAALAWSQAQHQVDAALRLGAALSRFWYIRGHFSEGRAALAAALALQPGAASGAAAARLNALRAKALQAAGDLERAQGAYDNARALCEESLALYRAAGDKREIAIALNRLAIVGWNQENFPQARDLFAESLAINRELGDERQIAVTTGNLGMVAFAESDYSAAGALLEESIALFGEQGDKFNIAIRINNLGNVALMQGDFAQARALHLDGLVRRRELADKWGIAVSLIGLGGAAVIAGEPLAGTRLLGAAGALLDELGVQLEPDDRIPLEYSRAAALAALGREEFDLAWAVGRDLGLAAAEGFG